MFIIYSAILMLIISSYVFVRVVLPFSLSKKKKILLFFLLLLLSQGIIFLRVVFRGADFSLFNVRLVSFALSLYILFALVLFVRDLLISLFYILNKIFRLKLYPYLSAICSKKAIFPLFLFTLSVVVYAGYQALKVPDVKRVSLTIPHLPEELKGITIVQLTDLHIGSAFDRRWLEKVVEKTNALNADFIVVTGDIVDAPVHKLAEEVVSLKNLKAKEDVYLIAGNHEYYADLAEWISYFRNMGMNFLVNESVIYEKNNAKLAFVGLADRTHGNYPKSLSLDNVKASENLPEDAVKILLAHQPKYAKENAKFGYDVQLAGHTHGGHAFFLFPLVANANDGYLSGFYNVDQMQLYVSNGTGLWGYFPVRLGAPSEITLFTLE